MLTVDLTVLTDFKSWTESIAMRYGIVMILQLLFSSATFRYSGSVVYPIYLAIYSVIRYPDIIYLVCAPFSSYGYIYFCSTMNEYIYAENVHNNRCDELATAAADGKHLLVDEVYERESKK